MARVLPKDQVTSRGSGQSTNIFNMLRKREVGAVPVQESAVSAAVNLILGLRVSPAQIVEQQQARTLMIALLTKHNSFSDLVIRILGDYFTDLNVGEDPCSIVELSAHLANAIDELLKKPEHQHHQVPTEAGDLEFLVLNSQFGTVGNIAYMGYSEEEEGERYIEEEEEEDMEYDQD